MEGLWKRELEVLKLWDSETEKGMLREAEKWGRSVGGREGCWRGFRSEIYHCLGVLPCESVSDTQGGLTLSLTMSTF